jgi:flagellar hook protein FlgE
VLVSEIASNFSQGGTQFTGKNTDMMINGSGFFAIERPDITSSAGNVSSNFYLTRAGNFTLDSGGNLVTSNGYRVRGTSQIAGTSPTTVTAVKIPQEMLIVKDLTATGARVRTHFAQVGTADATILAQRAPTATSQSIVKATLTSFSISGDGAITAVYSNGDRITVRTDSQTINTAQPELTRREMIHLTAEGDTFSADNDGNGAPSQTSDQGILTQINSVFTAPTGGNALEGMQLQLQTASVINPTGLLADSDNNYLVGPNSGATNFGVPGTQSRGTIQGGSLESSNVDLAAEFTNLIVAQRGVEANSKLIRAQSDVLQSIINIV